MSFTETTPNSPIKSVINIYFNNPEDHASVVSYFQVTNMLKNSAKFDFYKHMKFRNQAWICLREFQT